MTESRKGRLYRQLVTATLLMGGAFHLAAPVLAVGTQAGTDIINRATAVYDDGNGTTFNATSNTVTIKVAEVAGITVTSKAVTDTSANTPVVTGDIVNYDFEITNTGNDATKIYIPSTAATNGGTAGAIQYSTDGGTTYLARPANGLIDPVGPNTSILVRVPVTVTANAANATISVVLGNTGANDNTAGTQNQADDGASGDTLAGADEVRTVDGANAGETAGVPVNGEREASALGSIKLGATPQAFAAVTKTNSNYTDSGTPAVLTDDLLRYNLGLEVKGAAPAGATGLVAANLVGTNILFNGTLTAKILVSDAIPANTELSSVTTTPPAGWTVVYSTDNPTNNKAANDATVAWTTTAPAPAQLNTVKRIGFVHNGPLATGTTVSGLNFTVKTSGITTTTTIANIAQVFGQSENGGTTVVYDESGDANPSNYNDNGTPGSNTPTNGIADPGQDGTDNANNNSATNSPGGEDNVFTISAPGTVLNGPLNSPAATNTTNNDDFTNKSSAVAAGIAPGSKINPAIVTFQNTINNPSSTAITNLLLVPTAPATATDLPNGTTVKLTVGTQSATYTYNGTAFTYTPAAGDTAILINTLNPGASFNYTAVVDLPANTDLSTDTGKGYPVPIVAFVDRNADGTFTQAADGTNPNNTTIDQVYTGFLKLEKRARIINADGSAIPNYTSAFFATPTATDLSQFRPGRVVEYEIKYTNVSATSSGSGNGLLNANSVKITEDGTATPNNWALDLALPAGMDTSHVPNKAVSTNGGVIEYSNGATILGTSDPGAVDVTKYVNTLPGAIAPQANGTFTFQRKLN